jgi:hypothetical protein
MCDNVRMPSLKTTDCLVIVRTSQSREVLAVSERLEQREQARKTPVMISFPDPPSHHGVRHGSFAEQSVAKRDPVMMGFCPVLGVALFPITL